MLDKKISVCISTYNRIELLKLAIDSIIAQTYSNWELIVCDDGSTDGTSDYMSQITNDQIRYVRHPNNIGKSNNMRSGFDAAIGEYFVKLDDDDRFTPEFLSQTVEILNNYPNVDFVGTDHWIIDINNTRNISESQSCSEQWGRTELKTGVVEDLLEVVFVKGSFYIGSTLFRRQSLEDIGYMRPNIQNCEDSDLFLRLALAGKTGFYLPGRFMEYRFHGEQQGFNRAIPFLKDMLLYLESHHFESDKLEAIRQSRLCRNKLDLGLLLIQIGKINEGRKFILEGKSASYTKMGLGFLLSLLDSKWRLKLFRSLTAFKKVLSRVAVN
jgi:glycosyltransferase involved in cell wall biosynthesis